MLRDPLNNIASRLEAARIGLKCSVPMRPTSTCIASYCAEFVGLTDLLGNKVVVNFNRFVEAIAYRDLIAGELAFDNRDVLGEASDYGGSSSFSPGSRAQHEPRAVRPDSGSIAFPTT